MSIDRRYKLLKQGIDGGDIISGLVGTAFLGSGSADASVFLRGDQTWSNSLGFIGTAGQIGFNRSSDGATIGGIRANGSGMDWFSLSSGTVPINIDNLGGVNIKGVAGNTTLSVSQASGDAVINLQSTVSGDAYINLTTLGSTAMSLGNRRSDGSIVVASGSGLATPRWVFNSGTLSGLSDVGASPQLFLQNQNATDGRTTIQFTNNRTSNKTYELGIDPGGSGLKNFAVRDITRGVVPFQVDTAGSVRIAAPVSTNFALNVTMVSGTPGVFIQGAAAGQAALRVDLSATSGAATPSALTANKPGSNAGVTRWLPVSLDGTIGYIPVWS